ncbi:MAG: DNA translocase FtsK 4TM domain-containing protein [Candidatus Paceibacterota bacterium]|jgi:S-DNA-T family DNA segregation ATPase FtsK/SpoIIIE
MSKRKKQKKAVRREGEGSSTYKLSEKTSRIVWCGSSLLLSLILFFSFFDKAGMVGNGLKAVFNFLAGGSIYLLPIFLILSGLVFLKNKTTLKDVKNPLILSGLFLFLGCAGLLGLREINSDPDLSQHFKIFYGGQGGMLGYVLSFLLFKLFNFVLSIVIFLVAIIIGFSILVEALIKNFFEEPLFDKKDNDADDEEEEKKIKKPAKKDPALPSFLKMEKFKLPKKKEKEEPAKPLTLGNNLENFKVKELKALAKDETYELPPLSLLEDERSKPQSGDIGLNAGIIKRTLQNFGIPVEMSEINVGPTVTQYTLKPAEGVKVSKITNLSSDLALALASHPIRIEAPIPGRSLVGVEMPNKKRAMVRLRELLEQDEFQKSSSPLLFALGKDVKGSPIFASLAHMPHMLVAGSTGAGKTIGLNTIILSLLYRHGPADMRLIMVDPKRVEFSIYNSLNHLLCPVVVNPQKAVVALKWLVVEMERRFEFLAEKKSRDIDSYNNKNRKKDEPKLPYIILIIDELADLMSSRGKEIEVYIARLAQMARAVGIHLILATQRPSVEVITGLIKANITSRIAFQVASQIDSRTILDTSGAEKLIGKGDMLFVSTDLIKPRRIQGSFISEQEVKKVVAWILEHQKDAEATPESESLSQEMLNAQTLPDVAGGSGIMGQSGFSQGGDSDPLYEEAKNIVVSTHKASASFLQRKLKVGYARAARLLDILEEKGVIGPGEGAKAREVYMSSAERSLEEEEGPDIPLDDEEIGK